MFIFMHIDRTVALVMKVLSSGELIRMVEEAGWLFDRAKGSHHIYKHPEKPGLVVIPHPRRTMKRGTQRSIMKQAGLL
jgi:predicted RNA binding protein YcfA (HicA-like mRNA interferase family)